METLQRLTRRQVDALRAIERRETLDRGASLNEVAAELSVSAPSALAHLTGLEELGLVARHRGKSRVTSKGRGTLVEYRRHHRIAEGLFSSMGMPREEVCEAAREVDLAISHRTVERLCEAEGHPPVCPHGEPIAPCQRRRSGS